MANMNLAGPRVDSLKLDRELTFIERLRMAYLMRKIVANPQNTKAVFDYFHASFFLKNKDLVRHHISRMYELNPIQDDLSNRYDPGLHLRSIPKTKFPEGSLGEAAQNYFSGYQLDVDFYPLIFEKKPSPESYMIQRAYQAHDLFHVLLGIGITPLEEMAVLAFTAGQLGAPSAMNVAWMAYFHCLRANPFWGAELIGFMTHAFEVGRTTKSVIKYHLEVHLNEPIKKVRQELGVPIEGLRTPMAPKRASLI